MTTTIAGSSPALPGPTPTGQARATTFSALYPPCTHQKGRGQACLAPQQLFCAQPPPVETSTDLILSAVRPGRTRLEVRAAVRPRLTASGPCAPTRLADNSSKQRSRAFVVVARARCRDSPTGGRVSGRQPPPRRAADHRPLTTANASRCGGKKRRRVIVSVSKRRRLPLAQSRWRG
jgi:hypothetical protein